MAAALLWLVLNMAGVFDQVTADRLFDRPDSSGF